MTGQILWTVYRSGGEYTPAHVRALARNFYKLHPGGLLCVVTDVGLDIGETIAHVFVADNYPGWWQKANLFRKSYSDDDLLYCDLDTVLVGPLDDLWAVEGDIVLRDFYRLDDGIGSGVMKLTAPTRERIWTLWEKDPKAWMGELGGRGDQALLEVFERGEPEFRFKRWQDELPGKVLSYKVDIRDTDNRLSPTAPEGASVIAFHGHPRPWHAKHDWITNARV